MDGPHFVHPCIHGGHLCCFHLLTIVDSVTVNMCAHTYLSVPIHSLFVVLGLELRTSHMLNKYSTS
jgi:hypothetical protein